MSDSPRLPITRREALALAASAAALPAQSPAQPHKLGIIGLGNRAQRHLTALEEVSDARVTAISDIQPERMRAANEKLPEKATEYIDWRELIADRNVSAVAIVTPNFLHAEMALAALEAGKDVLIEKPIALNYDQARTIADTAKRLGRIAAVGMQRRYSAHDKVISELVNSGRIGEVRMAALAEYRGDWNPRTWRTRDPLTGKEMPWRFSAALAGSSLLEFSVHSYAFLYSMILSPLKQCWASGGAVAYPGRTTFDEIAATVEFENGVRLSHAYCGFMRGPEWHMTIVGSKGFVQSKRNEAVVQEMGGQPQPLELGGRSGLSNEVAMYRDFFESVRTRAPSPLNPEFAIEVTKIAWAARTAIDESRIVRGTEYA